MTLERVGYTFDSTDPVRAGRSFYGTEEACAAATAAL